MTIFEAILSPFIFFIEQVFLFSYKTTGNYGLSIILLSLIVSVLLLPVFILIERAKKRDDAVKAKMKPLLDEIKRCYKGQERYYYIKTLNRQYNYSTTRALIPILSLLLQIPFFIAAYQFLEHFEPLAGVSFLFIKNLSEPDSLLGVINVLPIIMTAVNLLTAYFYTKNGSSSERKQMVVVATLFLILLFRLPSGLVLYWTMNNVFSFLRLFITNPEVFRKTSTTKTQKRSAAFSLKAHLLTYKRAEIVVFCIASGVAIFTQLNWAFKNNFDDIVPRLFMAFSFGIVAAFLTPIAIVLYNKSRAVIRKINVHPKLFYALLFLSLYFHLAAIFYFTGINSELNYLSLIFLVPTQFIAFVYFLRAKKQVSSGLYSTVAFALVFTFLAQIFNLIVALSGKPITLSFFNFDITVAESTLASLIMPTIAFLVISFPFYYIQNRVKQIKRERSNWLIFGLALVYIVGLLFFWNPLLIYSSHAEMFDFAGIQIMQHNFDLFIKIFLSCALIYIFLSKRFKHNFLFFILVLTVISFIYSLIIPIHLGSLQESRFAEHEKLAVQPFYYVLEGLLLIAITIAIKWILDRKYFKYITIGLIVLNLFLISQTIYSVSQTGQFFETKKSMVAKQNGNNETAPHTLSFSKEKQNVLYYIFDGFQGIFAEKIFEEDPELKELFSGFVYYPNTLSISNYTHSSMPSLLGGSDYSVDEMNRAHDKTIGEIMTETSENFVEKIKNKGFDFTGSWMPYSKINYSTFKTVIPSWHKSWDSELEKIDQINQAEIWYTRLWENALFYSSPLCFKPVIYNDTKWLSGSHKPEERTPVPPKYNFVQIRPYISNTDSENPSFIYIHGTTAHNPWNIVNEKGSFIEDVTPYENNRWVLEQFGNWIKWMKENKVYNNTKIILISDHGASWGQYDGKNPFDYLRIIDNNDPEKVESKVFWRLNPLLMVKDYNTTGAVKEDWRLMCNADSPAIVFDEKNPTKGVAQKDRTLTTYYTKWHGEITKETSLDMYYTYTVSDTIFDLKNWKIIE